MPGGGRFPEDALVVCDTCNDAMKIDGSAQFMAFAQAHTRLNPTHKGFHMEHKKKC